jgi:hypothetical protein
MTSIFLSLEGVIIEGRDFLFFPSEAVKINGVRFTTYYWSEIRIRWRCSFGRFAVRQTELDARQLEHGDLLSHLILNPSISMYLGQ